MQSPQFIHPQCAVQLSGVSSGGHNLKATRGSMVSPRDDQRGGGTQTVRQPVGTAGGVHDMLRPAELAGLCKSGKSNASQ